MRLLLAAILAVSAILMIWVVRETAEFSWPDVLLNLATEAVGIAITVVLIESLLERRRKSAESQQMAKRALDDIDHAVWVWLGGARKYDVAEMMSLLKMVDDDAQPAPFTQNLFLQIAGRASNTLLVDNEGVRPNKSLRLGLIELDKLSAVRDSDGSLRPSDISKIVERSVNHLLKASGNPLIVEAEIPAELHYDPAIEKQRWRHFGD